MTDGSSLCHVLLIECWFERMASTMPKTWHLPGLTCMLEGFCDRVKQRQAALSFLVGFQLTFLCRFGIDKGLLVLQSGYISRGQYHTPKQVMSEYIDIELCWWVTVHLPTAAALSLSCAHPSVHVVSNSQILATSHSLQQQAWCCCIAQ